MFSYGSSFWVGIRTYLITLVYIYIYIYIYIYHIYIYIYNITYILHMHDITYILHIYDIISILYYMIQSATLGFLQSAIVGQTTFALCLTIVDWMKPSVTDCTMLIYIIYIYIYIYMCVCVCVCVCVICKYKCSILDIDHYLTILLHLFLH